MANSALLYQRYLSGLSTQDQQRFTAYHYAVLGGHTESVPALIAAFEGTSKTSDALAVLNATPPAHICVANNSGYALAPLSESFLLCMYSSYTILALVMCEEYMHALRAQHVLRI
jgi:hypothetical protein